MKITLLRGSYPTPGDSHSMVVSESLAVLAWPARRPDREAL